MIDFFSQQVPLASNENHVEKHQDGLREKIQFQGLLDPNRDQKEGKVDNYPIKEELTLFYEST
jgi:hypothetical protein